MLDKLRHARNVKAVVVAAPQSVKSLLLKWAEVHSILLNDKLLKSSGAGKVGKDGKPKKSGWGWWSSGKSKKEKNAKTNSKSQVKKTKTSKHLKKLQKHLSRMKHTAAHLLQSQEHKRLEQEARIIQDCIKVLQGGTVLMDEVDLLLHPLKSELHWPLGEKLPLDLTEAQDETSKKTTQIASAGSKHGESPLLADVGVAGLRWRVASHILNVLNVAVDLQADWKQGKERAVEMTMWAAGFPLDAASRSRQQNLLASKLVGNVVSTVKDGIECNALTTIPHLILLNTVWYHAKLLPVLVDWVAIYLHTCIPIPELELRNYLKNGEVTQAFDPPTRPRSQTCRSCKAMVDMFLTAWNESDQSR